ARRWIRRLRMAHRSLSPLPGDQAGKENDDVSQSSSCRQRQRRCSVDAECSADQDERSFLHADRRRHQKDCTAQRLDKRLDGKASDQAAWMAQKIKGEPDFARAQGPTRKLPQEARPHVASTLMYGAQCAIDSQRMCLHTTEPTR